MGILASLLPGARDLRAPLAAGYIFLVALWIVWFDEVPTRSDADGLAESLYRLGDVVGSAGTAIAMSFAAYLIGSFFQSLSEMTLEIFRDDRRWRYQDYLQYVRRELILGASTREIILRNRLHSGEIDRLIDDANMTRELEIIRARVRAEQPTLSGEYDLLQAEATFRLAISFPLASLIIAVAYAANQWLVLSGLSLLSLLWIQYGRLDSRADLTLIAAVTSGKVSPPLLEHVRAEIENLPTGREDS